MKSRRHVVAVGDLDATEQLAWYEFDEAVPPLGYRSGLDHSRTPDAEEFPPGGRGELELSCHAAPIRWKGWEVAGLRATARTKANIGEMSMALAAPLRATQKLEPAVRLPDWRRVLIASPVVGQAETRSQTKIRVSPGAMERPAPRSP